MLISQSKTRQNIEITNTPGVFEFVSIIRDKRFFNGRRKG